MEQLKIDDSRALTNALREFEDERTLIDVWIFDTRTEDWQTLIDSVKNSVYQWKFRVGDQPAELPDSLDSVFDKRKTSSVLSVDVSGIDIHSYFFCREEIDLDIDPHEVKSPQVLRELFKFLMRVSNSVNKKVVVTAEGSRNDPVFVFSPGSEPIEYRPHTR